MPILPLRFHGINALQFNPFPPIFTNATPAPATTTTADDMTESDAGEAPPVARPREELMDLDLDVETPWTTFDPASMPSSPFFLSLFSSPNLPPALHLPVSSSEQPASPLWAFSDGADDKSAATSALLPPGGVFIDRARLLPYNFDPRTGSIAEDVQKTKLFQASTGTTTDDNDSNESCIIKERMTQALRNFKDSIEQHFLVQVWAPIKDGDSWVLTTSGQPFAFDPHSTGLLQYRTVSLRYLFSVDGENGDLGLPGRVFRQKLPEWTPNVQYYSSKEYPRRNHALNYNVRGTLALPVFEPLGQSCVAVIELIMTSQKINYASEVDKVCKALEAVNLKSSDILEHPNRQICNEGRQDALGEILAMITVVCEAYNLPLAQTWVPCMHRSVLAFGGGSKKSCLSIDGSCMGQVCMSTTDVAFYVVDAHMWGFRDACAEHHLQRGQGAAGRAFQSHRSCFARNVTHFRKTEYPLVHYARMFGLVSCLAVCLRSSLTGSDDYVVEFFLPPSCIDPQGQEELVKRLMSAMRECFRTLIVFTENEFQGEMMDIIEPKTNEDTESKMKNSQGNLQSSSSRKSRNLLNVHERNHLENELGVHHNLQESGFCKEVNQKMCENEIGIANEPVVFSDNKTAKTSERRRGKTEKSISLEVLQQYFTGSLKDAAKSLGVCPTTMKRICRQHGISRWPSRKINKVNRSLSKLKRVIESVQGADGAFSLASLTSPLPVSVGSISLPVNLEVPTILPSTPNACQVQGRTDKESPSQRSVDEYGAGILNGDELVLRRSTSPVYITNGSPATRTRSGSGEESTSTPASQDSCQGSPGEEMRASNLQLVSSIQELGLNTKSSPVKLPNGEASLLAAFGVSDTLMTTEPLTPLGGMLIEDSGSCKDFRDLCNLAGDGFVEEVRNVDPLNVQGLPPLSRTTPHPSASQEVRTVTIKASYKEDIIRFRLPLSSFLLELEEEISKRLKLDIGTFDIKYLDDDHEWVLVACDADLQECLEVARSSGGNLIRLSVHDIMANLGSSCESTGEL